MIKSSRWFSIAEVIISVVILSIFLIWAYTAINTFHNLVKYIDLNLSGLNMTKSTIDDIFSLRNDYFTQYSNEWWNNFVKDYPAWTYVIKTNWYNWVYLSWIEDKRQNYEWPLDVFWNKVYDTVSSTYFLRKIDIEEENKFYLKELQRINNWTGEILKLNFSWELYNQKNFIISWWFENETYELDTNISWLSYHDIDWSSWNKKLNNLNNINLRYSKVVSYWNDLIQEGDYFSIKTETWTIKRIIFYNNLLPTLNENDIPLKIENSIDKNFYNICNNMSQLEWIDCEFNLFIKDNFYKKLIWIEREISSIDFGDNFSFTLSWASNNEIYINIENWILPNNSSFLYLNPSSEIKHNLNWSNNYDFLSIISDSTAWQWVEIPDKPLLSWEINTSTWYTSLYKIKVTTFLYDSWRFIDKYEVETKLWDINRYNIGLWN